MSLQNIDNRIRRRKWAGEVFEMEEQPELEARRAGDQADGKHLAAGVSQGFRRAPPSICEIFAVAVADNKYSVKVTIDLETPPCLLYESCRARLTIAGNQSHVCLIDAVRLTEPAYVIWLCLLALADDENCGQARTRGLLAGQTPALPQ